MSRTTSLGTKKKETIWYTDALRAEVRDWPKTVKTDIGEELNKVEYGGEPTNFKPMPTIGPGVNEIRASDDGNQYRLIYIAKKKTQQTSKHDIDIARKRFKTLVETRKKQQ